MSGPGGDGSGGIVVDAVSKRYGATLAVDRASFAIERGEVVGFLGPNGAGKSTLLKMISTWLPPDGGPIGYLPEHNALYETMRVGALLRFLGRVRGIAGPRLAERTAWVVERCGLVPVLRKRVQECSKGFRQRIGLAGALLHDPPILLLDEPTHGLDPLQVDAFLRFVRELAPGRAILFSSHVLSEVMAVSDRVLVIQHGRLLYDAPRAELQARADAAGTSLEGAVLEIVRADAQSPADAAGGGPR